MKLLENRIPPPALVLILIPTMWLVSKIQPAMLIEKPLWYRALTALVGLLALAFGLSGILSFRRARTTIDPVQIDQASLVVSTGIYRLTRNPMYVGLTGLLTMWAMHLAVPLAFVGPVAFALFVHYFQILPEERVMESKFGDKYLNYKSKVRRWL